jgi:hypothetical protein|eukprot:COSAG06_NODE_228_length_19725_cov_8.167839_23_plen_754_part_00
MTATRAARKHLTDSVCVCVNPANSGETLKYHKYELHYFNAGYVPGRAGAATGASTVATADFAQGSLYHVRLDKDSSKSPRRRRAAAAAVTSSAAAATAAMPEAAEVRHGHLEIQLKEPDTRWLQLLAADGTDRGALLNGEHGPVLAGSSGDFAEYHKKKVGEADFTEGDVICIGPHGLTRDTKGARQLGVISRRMIVAGSRPAVSELSQYDTVAFTGRVPVKLRGQYAVGDFVVPSGLCDGTAVAAGGFPTVRVGRAVHQMEPMGKSASSAGSRCLGAGAAAVRCACCRRREKREPWELIEITVLNPAETVIGYKWQSWMCGSLMRRILTAGMILLAVVVLAASWRAQSSDSRGGSLTSANHTHCPASSVCLQHEQRCSGCEDNSEMPTAVTFPDTDLSRATDRRTVVVECATLSRLMTGSLNRTCSASGWGKLEGACIPRRCPTYSIALPGLPSWAATVSSLGREQHQTCQEQMKASPVSITHRCVILMSNTLTFEQAFEGARRVVKCPSPSFTGEMQATCGENSQWTDITGLCERRFCPAEQARIITTSGIAVDIQLPRQQRTHDTHGGPRNPSQFGETPWHVVPCCSEFSHTGSCDGGGGSAFGSALVRCDEQGVHRISSNDSIGGHSCQPSTTVKSRLDLEDTASSGKMMYRAFRESVNTTVSRATGGGWRLPSSGLLTSVSMAVGLGAPPHHAAGTPLPDDANLNDDFAPVVSGERNGMRTGPSGPTLDGGMPVLSDQQLQGLEKVRK